MLGNAEAMLLCRSAILSLAVSPLFFQSERIRAVSNVIRVVTLKDDAVSVHPPNYTSIHMLHSGPQT